MKKTREETRLKKGKISHKKSSTRKRFDLFSCFLSSLSGLFLLLRRGVRGRPSRSSRSRSMPLASMVGSRPSVSCRGGAGALQSTMVASTSTSRSMPSSSTFLLSRRRGSNSGSFLPPLRAIGSGSFGEEEEPSKEAIERRK